MPERRGKPRFARRLQVHFWMQGDPSVHSGFTTNISALGMFVGTSTPLAPRTRVRVEVLDEERSFMIEGVVAHAARVAPALQKIRDSGMGVRFLTVNELVGELVPSARRSDRPAGDDGAEPEDAESADSPTGEEAPPATAPAAKKAPPPAPSTFTIRFASLPQFLDVFERDIINGGLFIPTRDPAARLEQVAIEIHIPPPVDRLVTATASVVQIVEGSGDDPNLLAGMGVAFEDRSGVLERINALIYAG